MADDRSDADPGESGSWFGRHQQVAWIGVIGSVLVALIALVPPILEFLDDDEPAGGTEPVAAPPSTSAEQPDVTSPPPSTDPTTPTPTPSSAAGTERWQGRLVLDSGPRDMDKAPPERVRYSDDGDIFTVGSMHVGGWNDTLISLWAGDPADPPGYQECADTIHAEGSGGQDIDEDSVLCVLTSDENLARLTFVESERGSDTITFEAVVWEGD